VLWKLMRVTGASRHHSGPHIFNSVGISLALVGARRRNHNMPIWSRNFQSAPSWLAVHCARTPPYHLSCTHGLVNEKHSVTKKSKFYCGVFTHQWRYRSRGG
jgi:hypothetical protein